MNIINESLLAEDLPSPDKLVDINAIYYYVSNEIDWSGGDGENLIEEFSREYDIPEDHVDIQSSDFQHWFRDWATDRVYDAWDRFQHLFDGEGNATLYRVITAPEDWKPDAQHPGIYWSWDKNAAQAHWGDFSTGMVKWRMAAVINASVVDWTATLAQNIMPNYSDEREIRIQEDATVKIVKVERL